MKAIGFLLLTTVGAIAQLDNNVPPPLPEVSPGASPGQGIIQEVAKPVIINGKPANEMTEEEMMHFLQGKIKTIEQEDGEVLPLRVAPGYAVKLLFEEPYSDAIVGDKTLCDITKVGSKIIAFTARQRSGDTNLSVFFPGGLVRQYHLFIEANFSTADDFYRVLAAKMPVESNIGRGTAGSNFFVTNDGTINTALVSNLINNYDALLQEGAVDTNRIVRKDIYRTGAHGAWVYYYLFQFSNGSAAISFRYRNPAGRACDFHRSRVRVQIAQTLFVPDFISSDKDYIGPGQSCVGYVFFRHPRFSLDQPFELVWD